MAKPRVLVTSRWPAAVEAALTQRFDTVFSHGGRALNGAELSDALGAVDAVLPGVHERIDAAVLTRHRPRARLLAAAGVGEDHIDLEAARASGITVTDTPDALSSATADLTLMLMIAVARQAAGRRTPALRLVSGGRPTAGDCAGAGLAGKTLGLVGFGRVGRQVARRAHGGFGMTVAVFDPQPIAPACLARKGAVQLDTIDEVVAAADVLSLHCPADPATRHLIDARRFDLMKPEALLVNTARGEVVEARALLHALWFDCIAGAALDSPDGDGELLRQLGACPTAVLTRPQGRSELPDREALGLRVVQNIEDFFAGRRPRDCVTN